MYQEVLAFRISEITWYNKEQRGTNIHLNIFLVSKSYFRVVLLIPNSCTKSLARIGVPNDSLKIKIGVIEYEKIKQ